MLMLMYRLSLRLFTFSSKNGSSEQDHFFLEVLNQFHCKRKCSLSFQSLLSLLVFINLDLHLSLVSFRISPAQCSSTVQNNEYKDVNTVGHNIDCGPLSEQLTL